jgi:hypothetical protein
MHYFVAEIRQQEIGSVHVFATRAENVYEENLNAYVKIVLRRPFSKIIVSISSFSKSNLAILSSIRITLMVSSKC